MVPGCKFPDGRYREDLDRHVREKHGTTVDVFSESVLVKTSTKTLPAVKPHVTSQSDHEEVEYISKEYDDRGEAKISPIGELLGGRVFRIRTFVIPDRSEKHLMLATECARVLGYRDPYLLFNKTRSLLKIIATQQEKEDLIQQGILPFSCQSRQISLVSAKSIFRQFGARVIEGGRRVRDDYWEAKAVERGYTEEDMPGHGPSKEGRDSSVREISPLPNWQYENPRQNKNDADRINLGRMDALSPPSQESLMVILLSIYSIDQIPFICSFCYALWSQSLKL